MKFLVNIARVIVGVLFIFSGLVKANDPLGLSYKMQEFFDVWSQHASLVLLMHWLDNYALIFSIVMITLEIVIGVALLIGWSRKLVSWLLLLLMIFFTFLTGYAVLSGKIRTCGCFGDCIPLTAMESFMKDIFLCLLVLIILFGNKYIRPVMSKGISMFLIIVSLIIVISIQWHVLRHQPFTDCLPYKKGNNILELRKMPADAVADSILIIYTYQNNGNTREFKMDSLPDSKWTYVSRKDILVKEGKNNVPPIKDFFLNTLSGGDTTEALLSQPGNYYLYFVKDITEITSEKLKDFTALVGRAGQTPIYIVASQASLADEFFNRTNHFNLPVFSLDATSLKTASRTDPSLYLMHGPIVQNKWGWEDIHKAR